MARMLSVPFCLLALANSGKADVQDALPTLVVSLDPPLHPNPNVARLLGSAESRREHFETGEMQQIYRAKEAATARAKAAVHQLTSRFGAGHSFLAKRTSAEAGPLSTIDVAVQGQVAEPDVSQAIADLEAGNFAAEASLLDQAKRGFSDLADLVAVQLEAELRGRGAAFIKSPRAFLARNTLANSPQQVNVKVSSSDSAYPTVAKLAQDAESRRALAEELEVAQISDLKLDMLKEINSEIRAALR